MLMISSVAIVTYSRVRRCLRLEAWACSLTFGGDSKPQHDSTTWSIPSVNCVTQFWGTQPFISKHAYMMDDYAMPT